MNELRMDIFDWIGVIIGGVTLLVLCVWQFYDSYINH